MLSDKTKQHIKTLLASQDDYRPSTETRLGLSEKTLIMLVGPTGAGKSTVMRQFTTLDPNISIVGTITTRAPRHDDHIERYTFYEHSEAGLQPLFDNISKGKLVQYVVNPYSHQIYGSSLSDYPSDVNIGDFFSNVIEPFHDYGFGRVIPITIVTSGESWLNRFNQRFPVGHPQRASRRAEAITSLRWSLDKHKTAHFFVLNPEGSAMEAAKDIAMILNGGLPNQAQARAAAKECLAVIQKLAS